MNLAHLERMVGEGDLSKDACLYLLQCRGECEWLDFKEQLSLESEVELCGFARDVLAMKNVGGGYLVVGVMDKTWQVVGLAAPFPYDSKLLRDKVRSATGVELEVDVVTHPVESEGAKVLCALIHVRSSKKRRKRRSPTLVARDFCATKPFGMRRGEIYLRRGDSTVKVASEEELRDLLERLEAQSDEDAVRGDAAPSPFAVEDGTYRLLPRGYDRFVGRADLRERLVGAICGDPRIWIVNVHGPGGVGKSALVNWAAYRLYEERRFEAILQLTAKETALTEKGIRPLSRSLYSLENLLDQILLLFEENPEQELEAKRLLAIELLSAWKTLIILDNMETVSDGRILAFVQGLPPDSKAKVLLTSRSKTGGWELPLAVTELNGVEVQEFLAIKSAELSAGFPIDPDSIARVTEASGGLPLAIQWIIGQYKQSRRLDLVVRDAKGKDSPILEFSFRNIWMTLAQEARTVLALLSIFDGPVTVQQVCLATQMNADQVERALSELADVTLVTRSVQQPEGSIVYSALPITLSFARNELAGMGELEVRARQRVQQFVDQMELQVSEVARFRGEFEKFGIGTANEKRAVILCRRAESEVFAGNVDGAELLFEQAREMAPNSAYVLARIASYALARNRVGAALERAKEACQRASKKTGALCYGVKARVLDVQRDRAGRLEALGEALKFDPGDPVLRHQYGVALSRMGLEREAIEQFSQIVAEEEKRVPPRETLLMALTTRVINCKRLGRLDEARADVEKGRRVIEQYPHLGHAWRGAEEIEVDQAK